MNTSTNRKPTPSTPTNRVPISTGAEQQDFEQVDPLSIVEHATVPGFFRRIPHRWHLDDMIRFGDKVRRTAEAMELSYLTTTDRSLGVIRLYPMPLMERIYDVLARQHNWPPIVELPQIDGGKQMVKDMLRGQERLEKSLRAVIETNATEEVRACAGIVLSWLEGEMARLRAEIGEESEAETE